MNELPLTDREIKLIQDIGVLRALMDVKELLLLVWATRSGGTVKITSEELAHVRRTYKLEKNIRADDLTQDIVLNARLG